MNQLYSKLVEILFYSSSEFSNELFNNGIYSLIGWAFFIISPVLFNLIYYKIIDSPRYVKVIYWIITCLINSITAFILTVVITNSILQNVGYTDESAFILSDYLTFGLITALYSFIMFFLHSLYFRFLSLSCNRTPF